MKIFKVLKDNYLLVLIMMAAILLRFLAVKPGYNQYHGDETAIWGSANVMVKAGNLDPGRYDYPGTAALINLFFYKLFFVPLSWLKYFVENIGQIIDGKVKIPLPPAEIKRVFGIYILGIRDINTLFWSRYITAFFGVGTVFLTYILSKKMFSRNVGLLTALFLTFNYRNVVNSHITLPDIYNAFFVLLALITYWNLYQKPSRKNYLLAGLSAGVAFSIKYQYFAVIPLLFVHLLLTLKGGFNLKKLFNPYIVMAGFCILLVFVLTNPYFFMNIELVLIKMKEEFVKYGMGTNTLNLFPLSYLFHIDYGPPLFVLTVLGVLYGLSKNTIKSVFLLSLVVPAFYMFIYYSRGGFYVRNFITTTPQLLIFAALISWTFIELVYKKFGKYLAVVIFAPLLIGSLYLPARNSILSTYGYIKPWGYDILRPWIQKNLPTDVTVAVHPFDKSNLEIKNSATKFSHSEAYSLSEHIENGADYVIVNLNWASLPFYTWMNYGFNEARFLWNKPVEIMRNTYHGIAAYELFRYQIHTVTRPWQSPDTHFVIVKVPQWPKIVMPKIKSYTFDTGLDGWTIRGRFLPYTEDRYKYDSITGNLNNGSLMLNPGGERFPTIRITSQPITIKKGYLYKIAAFLKTDLILPLNEREGFIRLDFYADNPDLERLGLISSVSSRVYGTNEWVKKEITQRAPEGAKYLTVSFQSYATAVTKIWMDDVEIYESVNSVEDITSQSPYTKNPIDDNYLFPNSHGNL